MNDVQFVAYQYLRHKPVRQFILEHEHADETKLVLKAPTILGVPSAIIANQIAGQRKAKDKLPLFHGEPDIIYPRGINIEQCSSEATAMFKGDLLANAVSAHGSLVDLTGGFGIDSFFFSRRFDTITYVEPDAELRFVAQHNHQQLGASNIDHRGMTAEEFLRLNPATSVDAVYIDPSRRKDTRKVFRLSDCSPDVTAMQPQIFTITDTLLIKASPMLDVTMALQDLMNVIRVTVVSVDNECRELLFLCRKRFAGEPQISAVSIHGESVDEFGFRMTDEKDAIAPLGRPMRFLYEPNASILKAGAFRLIATRFGLTKLHSNTHLYTSNKRIDRFPGRTFEVTVETKADAKAVRNTIPDMKANILVRNYPSSPDELRKKLRLHDGGDVFLIATTSIEGRHILVTRRV